MRNCTNISPVFWLCSTLIFAFVRFGQFQYIPVNLLSTNKFYFRFRSNGKTVDIRNLLFNSSVLDFAAAEHVCHVLFSCMYALFMSLFIFGRFLVSRDFLYDFCHALNVCLIIKTCTVSLTC